MQKNNLCRDVARRNVGALQQGSTFRGWGGIEFDRIFSYSSFIAVNNSLRGLQTLKLPPKYALERKPTFSQLIGSDAGCSGTDSTQADQRRQVSRPGIRRDFGFGAYHLSYK